MTDQSIDTLMNEHFAFAQRELLNRGTVFPMFVVFLDDLTMPLPVEFQNASQKDATMNFVRTLIAAYWPQSVAFMCETWYRTGASVENAYRPLSQCADAREGVVIQVATPAAEKIALHEIVRGSDGAPERLVENHLPADTSFQGRMPGLYPATAPAPQEQIKLRSVVAENIDEKVASALDARARTPRSAH